MMNLLLHGIEGGVELVDTLSPDGERLPKADLSLKRLKAMFLEILSNELHPAP